MDKLSKIPKTYIDRISRNGESDSSAVPLLSGNHIPEVMETATDIKSEKVSESIPDIPLTVLKSRKNPEANSCHCCGERDFWKSKAGKVICRICHPPAPNAELLPPPRIRKFVSPLYDRPTDRACPQCGSLYRWENTNNLVSCQGCYPNTDPEAVWQWYKIENGRLNPIDCPTSTNSNK